MLNHYSVVKIYLKPPPLVVASEKPTLLVAKGVISRMGGAERDLLRRLPHLTNWYQVTVATLSSCNELEKICEINDISLIKPSEPWNPPVSSIGQLLDSTHKSSKLSWLSCHQLIDKMEEFDYFHVVSGDGYLGIIELIPPHKKSHLYLHEPHRGYHEDSLHRDLYGRLKRPKLITRLLLSKGRNNDLRIVKKFASNPNNIVTGNSSYSAQRADTIYGLKCSFLHPCIDRNEYSDTGSVKNPFTTDKNSEYVVTVGVANWAKGSMEAIAMLKGTSITLVHVGGGSQQELTTLQNHANDNNVKLWVSHHLSSPELSALIRDALAVISFAHKEPFGLTPIEAFSIGTPALFVDEGGFRDTIIDQECGRLLPRDDMKQWHEALSQARNPDTRAEWSANGIARIEQLKLSPFEQAQKIHQLLQY